MPINLTVQTHGTGTATPQTIAGDGPIDTREEAQAALALMTNDDDTITVAGTTYTKAQIQAIANPPADSAAATPVVENTLTRPMTLYIAPEFAGVGGTYHLGGNASMLWNFPVSADQRHMFQVGPTLVGSGRLGGDGSSLPFGQPQLDTGATSYMFQPSYRFGVGVTGGYRWNPAGGFFLNPLVTVGLGLMGYNAITGRNSGDQYNTNLCGIAGPNVHGCPPLGAAGTPGHDNNTTDAGTTGALFARGILNLGYDFGPAMAYVGGGGGVWMPFSGPGGAQPEWIVNAGVSIPLGSSSTPTPRADDTTPIVDTAHGSAAGTVGVAASHSEDEIRTLGGLDAGARIMGVQFDNMTEDTSAPYEIPASAMTAGPHQIKIRYRNPGSDRDHIKIVDYTVNQPVTTTTNPSAAIPTVNPTVSRPAAVPGVAAGPLTIGQVEVTSALPQGSVYAIFVDGNEVGTVPLQPSRPGTDHTTPITIPSSVADGAHQIGLRLRQPGQTEVRLNDRPITIGPAFPTLSAADAVADPVAPPYRYQRAAFSVQVTASSPGWIRITAGGNTWDKQVQAGPNTISLLAAGEARQYYTGNVSFQPLTAQGGTLTGTAVSSTHSVILGVRAGGGTPTPRPPARPLP